MLVQDRPIELREKATIEAFLRKDTALHLYALGDLDDFFWPFTTWFGLRRGDALAAVFLLYHAPELPVLLALEQADTESALTLLAGLAPTLPDRFYAHVSPGLHGPLRSHFDIEARGKHRKMHLVRPSEARQFPEGPLPSVPLTRADLPAIRALYRVAYEGNWFDERMLDTGHYVGAFDGAALVAIAGVHVHSARHRVAALGNVTTHPTHRGRGLATAVTGSLCRRLLETVDDIGLNVDAENATAIRCYERLGFELTGTYDELVATRGSAPGRACASIPS